MDDDQGAGADTGTRSGLSTAAVELLGAARALGDVSGADIDALCFIVMMIASKSAQDDLRAIMGEVRELNHKERERRLAVSVEVQAKVFEAMEVLIKSSASDDGDSDDPPPG